LFEKNIVALAESLGRVLQGALRDYEQLRLAGVKGELSHVYISFLQSSVLCKLPWLRLDLYDENNRSDVVECFADWDVPGISEHLYRGVDKLVIETGWMEDYELEQAWIDASDGYFNCFESFLPQIISMCVGASAMHCRWHFGQFLGNTVVVRESSKDEIF